MLNVLNKNNHKYKVFIKALIRELSIPAILWTQIIFNSSRSQQPSEYLDCIFLFVNNKKIVKN